MRLKRFQKRGVVDLVLKENNGQVKLKEYTCFYGGEEYGSSYKESFIFEDGRG